MKHFLKICVCLFCAVFICGNAWAEDYFTLPPKENLLPTQPYQKNKMWSDLNARSNAITSDMRSAERERDKLQGFAEAKWQESQSGLLPGFRMTQSKTEYMDSYMHENGFSGTYPNYSSEKLDGYKKELTDIQAKQKVVEKTVQMSDEEKAQKLSELEAERDRSLKEAESKWEQGKTAEELKNTDAKAMFVNEQMKGNGYTGTYPSYSNFDLDVFQSLSAPPNLKDMTQPELLEETKKLEEERENLLKGVEEKWKETPEGQQPEGNTSAERDNYYAKKRAFIIKYMKDHGYNFRDSLYGSKSYRALFDVQYYDNDRLTALKSELYMRTSQTIGQPFNGQAFNTNFPNPQLDSQGRIYNSHTNTTVVIPYDIAPKVQPSAPAAPSFPTPPTPETELISDEFKSLYDVIQTNFPKARAIVYLFSGFGLIAVALMAIFGKMRLQWLVMIMVSLFLLASTEAIISYSFDAGKGTPSTLTSGQVEDMFNYGPKKTTIGLSSQKNNDGSVTFSYKPVNVKTKEGNLTLHDDSNDFDYDKMKASSAKVDDMVMSPLLEQRKNKMFFSNVRTLIETLINLRVIVYVLSGFALVGLAIMAIMGKLDWALFCVIGISLFVLSGTEALMAHAYYSGIKERFSQIKADWANSQFNNGTGEQLKLRDDSNDFNFLK